MRVKNFNPNYTKIYFSLSDINGNNLKIVNRKIDINNLKMKYGEHNLICIYEDETKKISGCIIEDNINQDEYMTYCLNKEN